MDNQSPTPHGAELDHRLSDILALALSKPTDQPVGCDTHAYLAELDGLDVDPAIKIEFIHRLWVLIETVVRIQFRLDPVSDALRAQDFERASNTASLIKSDGPLNDIFNAANGEGR
ncbi:hypothetical protein [Maricaulis sp.]|uniref:hypothetical protein n=1 Tax=Maricaulis sp. TaxID=1486257 RepID=UPI0026238244|nr:hypothetical protein [Maricaulis sp.]